MRRKIGLLGIVGLLIAAAPVCVDETFTITIKKSGEGAVTQHKKEGTANSHVTLEGPDGKALNEEKKAESTIEEYKETILAKEKGKRATKIRREYSKAVVTANGKEQTLAYNGKTLLIEKKGDKYHFTIEGSEELKGKDAESLNRAFNKPNGDDSDSEEMEKAFLPKKPLAVNDTWKMDSGDVVKALGREIEQNFPVDKSKATGQGKLLRAYKKDGRQFGVMDIEVNVPLKGDLPVGKDQKAPIREGSKMTLHVKVDGCIDGTSSDSVSDTSMNIDLAAAIKTPEGKELKLTIHIVGKEKERETDLAKK
ncbi:MAG TPA: hypothetical protein VMF69_10065 [Gemmataceae bacterium]|nr:hypothetical protein [Gemmataceae bacterium]